MNPINYIGYSFSSPAPYWSPAVPAGGGVYAIQVPNLMWGPMTVQPIYFGQTSNFFDRHYQNHHEAFARWTAYPGSLRGMFISFFAMPHANQREREFVEGKLISYYRPVCNRPAQRMTLGGLLGLSQDFSDATPGLLGFAGR
jgi:hypothetical protein